MLALWDWWRPFRLFLANWNVPFSLDENIIQLSVRIIGHLLTEIRVAGQLSPQWPWQLKNPSIRLSFGIKYFMRKKNHALLSWYLTIQLFRYKDFISTLFTFPPGTYSSMLWDTYLSEELNISYSFTMMVLPKSVVSRMSWSPPIDNTEHYTQDNTHPLYTVGQSSKHTHEKPMWLSWS